MRSKDPSTQEDGFHWLRPYASEYVGELMQEFESEKSLGLQCWFLELIGDAKSEKSLAFLASQLRSPNERFRYWAIRGLRLLDTKESRTRLFEARKLEFESPEATLQFRQDLEKRDW